MRFALLRWLVWLCLAVPQLALAAGERVPDFTGLVVDETGTLDEDSQRALQKRLGTFQNTGRAQAAILVVNGTEGLALADYSLLVAQSWKLGHAGRDDGLLIVIVPSLTAARIEVGYGLEAVVPDVKAARWIDAILLPSIKEKQLAQGLHGVLDQLDAVLPAPPQAKEPDLNILDRHPEWKLPFVFAVFSPFALFPLFFGGWGAFASAPLFATFLGAASWTLWGSRPATASVAACAFVLPLLWNLNRRQRALPTWLRVARHVGNFAAVAIFFAVITMFVGTGLSGQVEETWAAPLFAGLLALGLAAVLFPGKPAYVIGIVLRSFMHFVFILLVAYLALQEFIPQPAKIAFEVAGTFTAVVALALYLDSRETRRSAAGEQVTRWSHWLVGLALLVAFPFAAVLLVQSVLGEDLHTQLAEAAAGGGSLGSVIWWAARKGFFGALMIGLGGKFGGGGAEGRG